jgi:hypothetical protein
MGAPHLGESELRALVATGGPGRDRRAWSRPEALNPEIFRLRRIGKPNNRRPTGSGCWVKNPLKSGKPGNKLLGQGCTRRTRRTRSTSFTNCPEYHATTCGFFCGTQSKLVIKIEEHVRVERASSVATSYLVMKRKPCFFPGGVGCINSLMVDFDRPCIIPNIRINEVNHHTSISSSAKF